MFEISNKLHPSNSYEVIFVVQHDNGLCNAYIIDTPNTNNQTLNAFYWELPSFVEASAEQALVYSTKHGLILWCQ